MTGVDFIALAGLVAAAVPCGLFLWNVVLYRPAREGDRVSRGASGQPGVSILIPARNEEANIREALECALASEGVDLEVLVLDDESEDRTAEIVAEMARTDSRLALHRSESLPPGWCGKQFACHSLARAAGKPLLLFVDADVRLSRDAALRLAAEMEASADLISVVPHQVTGSWSEKLLIPLIHFVLLGYLPLWAMRRYRSTGFGAGCGQLFMARREAYFEAGGHEAIKATLHDGLRLPKAFREAGRVTDLVDATDIAECRLYHDAREVWNGLLKNATEGLGAPAAIVPMTALLLGGQVLPPALLIFAPVFGLPLSALSVAMLGVATMCGLLPRVISARRFRQPAVPVVFHPLAVAALELIQWVALARNLVSRGSSWKGRAYPSAARKVL